jgi:hypothetical protein
LTLGVVAASIVGWGQLLPKTGPAAEGKRMTASIAANTLAANCIRASTDLFAGSESTVDVCSSPSWRASPAAEGFNLEGACGDGVLTNGEAIGMCAHSTAQKPFGLVLEIGKGLRELYSLGSHPHEHFAIAHKTFRTGRGESPVFWLPDEMRPRVASYEQPGIESRGPLQLLGRLAPLSVFLHAGLGMLTILLALASLVLMWREKGRNDPLTAVLFVASNTAAAYSITLSIFGLTIDRYQYPVFPVSVVAAALALVKWIPPAVKLIASRQMGSGS